MQQMIWIAAGAVFGANARYLAGQWAARTLGTGFPYGTLIVNIVGSFLLGLLVILTTERLAVSTEVRLMLTVGFLGAFTTFSSFSVETLFLLRDGSLGLALVNVLANNAVGLLAAYTGVLVARWLASL